jgi:hypothetical protein
VGARPRSVPDDYLEGRVIAAHRVDGDADGASLTVRTVLRSTGSGRLLRLFLLDLDRGPAGVVAAHRAGVMDLLGLVAVRARLEVRDRHRVVGAAVALSGV